MGIVSETISNLISNQVNNSGLVVWYDPEKHYVDLVGMFQHPDIKIATYDGSYFALRQSINQMIDDENPPRLVVYVPLDPADTHNALIELTAAGVTLKPGQQPPSRNTRLSIIARNALKEVMGKEAISSIEKQVDEDKLSLAELDALAEKAGGPGSGVVTSIFKTSVPQEVALAFLGSSDHDEAIINKQSLPELALLLEVTYGDSLTTYKTPTELRLAFARYILATDLIHNLTGEIPTQLATVSLSDKKAVREACADLASAWRLRRDLHPSYLELSNLAAQVLKVAAIDWSLEAISRLETFFETEQALQERVEEALLEKASLALVELAQQRLSSFWAESRPDIQARWALIAVAGLVLLESNRIGKALKDPGLTANQIFYAYTSGDHPWCLLDTHHRHMERRYHNFDFGLGREHRPLERLVIQAREGYMQIGATLAERFMQCYRNTHFKIEGALLQTQIYSKFIQPVLGKGKTAYVWVDALRFEMARELAQTQEDSFEVALTAALAAVPTITEIGMAALLPHQETPTVIPLEKSKLALQIGDTVVGSRPERVKYLQDHAGVSVFDARLDDLLPKPKKAIREGIRQADLVLITSQEIDALCEGDNIPLARRTMDGILHELGRAFQVLAALGVETILVTADHGYLFGDELSLDMKINSPGGDTVDLHRRVWVGHGGAASPAYLRAKLSDFGLGGDLEIAVPWSLAAFKVKGGANAYFHGGLSPQELIIPVITLSNRKKEKAGLVSEIGWTLEPGSVKISTRFFSVQIKGQATGLFEIIPPKVRLEIQAKGECISQPISASYGFEEATGNVQLKVTPDNPKELEPNTITLMISSSGQKQVSAHLIDAASGVELAHLSDIKMVISL
ncbi:MAG: PglZ domain-containing protein [Anaerolineales bacterium]|nr:PglZ domain-containing protein [Anaerolineales bacterium]